MSLRVLLFGLFLPFITTFELEKCNRYLNTANIWLNKTQTRICPEDVESINAEKILKCQAPPRDVYIYPANSTYHDAGNNASFFCFAKSFANTTYHWTKNGITISTRSLLQLHSIKPSQAGKYICNVSSDFGNDSSTMNLEVGYIKEVVMKTSFSTKPPKEGFNISVGCIVKSSSSNAKISIEWELNDFRIQPTAKSRFQITNKNTKNLVYQSTLQIRELKQRDSGQLRCSSILGSKKKYHYTNMVVMAYKLKAMPRVIEKGGNTSVVCEIISSVKSKSSKQLSMCKSGQNIPDSQLNYSNNKVTYSLENVMENTQVGCKWINETDCGKLVDIEVYNPYIVPCLAEVDGNNITWNETHAGITAYQSCPAGFTGNASRECINNNFSGEWKESNLLNCTREVLTQIIDKLDRIQNDGILADDIVNVLQTFSKQTNEIVVQNDSTASDIKSSVEILTQVSSVITEREDNITKEETIEMLTSTDVILDAGTTKSWEDLQEKTGENFAAKIMKLVSDVSDKVMDTLQANESVNIIEKNIVMQVKNEDPQNDIEFPDGSDEIPSLQSSVFLSHTAISDSLDANGNAGYSVVYYRTLSQLLPKGSTSQKVFSPVIAFTMPKRNSERKLDPPIQLHFETYESSISNVACAYWNFNTTYGGEWASDGCTIYHSTKNSTECRCNHLTNFAVLMSLHKMPAVHDKVMSYITLVGCIVSILCLAITILLYAIEWRHVRSDKSVVLVILCITLILTNVVFLVGIEQTKNKVLCTTIAVILHVLFLTVLCLMASEGIIHLVLVVSVFPSHRSLNRILLPLAFGIPVLLVTIVGGASKLQGYGTSIFCWLTLDNGLIYAFFVPCAAVVFMNLIITGVILKKLFSTRSTMNKSRKEKLKAGIRSIAILSPIFGLTWLFGLLSFHKDMIVFSYLFVLFNSLQGLLILILHTVINQTIKTSVKRRISRFRKLQQFNTSNNTASTDTKMKKIMAEKCGPELSTHPLFRKMAESSLERISDDGTTNNLHFPEEEIESEDIK